MLITKESSNRLAAERKSATDDLAGHVGSVLRELNSVRIETKRLLDQRRQLEVYLTALRTELEGLRAEKVELMALKAQVKPHVSTEAEVDLVARARAAAHGTPLPTSTPAQPVPAIAGTMPAVPTPQELAQTASTTKSEIAAAAEVAPAPTKPQPADLAPRGKKDEDAFRAFLLADEDHDKSREWFMSQA